MNEKSKGTCPSAETHAKPGESLSELLGEGTRLADAGRMDEAEAACREAVERFPKAAGAHLALARALLRRGRGAEAIAAFQKAVDLNPEEPDYLVVLADVMRERGQVEAAIRNYRAALERAPEHPWAHVGLGHAALGRGQLQEAAAHFRVAVKERPNDTAISLRLAELALRVSEQDEAAALFARVLELLPGNARALVGLGHVARGQGRVAEAVAHYQAAAAGSTRDAGLQLDIGDLLHGLGRLDEAAAAYAAAMRLAPGQPEHVRAYVRLGQSAAAHGNHAGALAHYEAAVALQPEEPERHMHLADTLRELGRVDEAEARYREALNLAPKNGWAFFGLGKCARAKGRRGEAVAFFNACTLLEPHNFWPVLELAQEQQEAGERDAARQTLEDLLARFPGNKNALLALGNLERYGGNPERALAVFGMGHAAHPGEAAFLIRMAELCRELNDEAGFLAHITAALALAPHDADAIKALAAFHLLKEQPEAAFALFAGPMAANPEDNSLATAYADMLAQAGFADECLAVLDELRARGADNPGLARQRISLLRLSGRIPEAVAGAEAAVERWPHEFELRNELFHAGLFWLDEDVLLASLAQMQPATMHHNAVLSRNQGRLAELQFHLAKAVRHYEEAARLNTTDASLQNDLARLKMMQMDLAGARGHLTRSRDLDAPNLRLKGKSLNISQTMFGQILDDFVLAEYSRPMAQFLDMPPDARLAALAGAVREEPGNTALAMLLLLGLREQGICAWENEGPRPGVPARIIQFWDSRDIPEDIAGIMQSWRDHNPDFVVQVFDDAAARDYLRAHFPPPVLQAYLRVREPAQKSDLLRLAVLAEEGGVYADADDRCIGKLAPVVGQGSQLVVYQEEFGTAGNNFMAAGPRHPMILHALEQAVLAINRGDSDIVWLATGPGLLTRAFAHAYITPGGLPGRTRLLDRRGLGRVVAMHCTANYKRGGRHWLNANFPKSGRGKGKPL